MMKVIKITKQSESSDIEKGDEFFNTTHGIIGSEFTLCGVACEEWDYTNFEYVKKITCKDCLDIIKECKSYKG